MRTEKATREAVEAAIRTIEAQGSEPSAARVLEITGGNKATVLRHMKGLGYALSRQAQKPADDASTLLLLEKAKPFISELLAIARGLERATFESATKRYHDSMQELEAALEEQGAEVDALMAERDGLREDLELVQMERDELRAAVAAAHQRTRDAESRMEELEAVNRAVELVASNSAQLEARLLQLMDDKMRSLAEVSS